MDRRVSIYLDLLRALAAIEVFLSHFSEERFGGALSAFRPYGQDAVIVFFVLSGYVIAYVANERETDLGKYAISRVARIYSVALPAILLTAVIDLLLERRGVDADIAYQLARPWKYLPLFLSFGTNWWFLNEGVFSDAPFWSLSYEVWYYALFGAWHYLGRRRVAACAAILLLVGPPSWILLPVWLSGVWLYSFHSRATWQKVRARVIWTVSAGTLIALLATKIYRFPTEALYALFGDGLSHYLRYSQKFPEHYLVAAIVVLNIASVKYCDFGFGFFKRPIRLAATASFTLYLFHWPLLEFLSQWLSPPELAVSVFAIVAAATVFTEQFRDLIRTQLTRLLTTGTYKVPP